MAPSEYSSAIFAHDLQSASVESARKNIKRRPPHPGLYWVVPVHRVHQASQ